MSRLVVTSDAPGTKVQVVEVTHEALIRHWRCLRNWLDEDRSSLRLRETVRQAAFDWNLHQRNESSLIHCGGRLEDVRQLSQLPQFAFNELEQTYLDTCLAFVEKERRAKERRRRFILCRLRKSWPQLQLAWQFLGLPRARFLMKERL